MLTKMETVFKKHSKKIAISNLSLWRDGSKWNVATYMIKSHRNVILFKSKQISLF